MKLWFSQSFFLTNMYLINQAFSFIQVINFKIYISLYKYERKEPTEKLAADQTHVFFSNMHSRQALPRLYLYIKRTTKSFSNYMQMNTQLCKPIKTDDRTWRRESTSFILILKAHQRHSRRWNSLVAHPVKTKFFLPTHNVWAAKLHSVILHQKKIWEALNSTALFFG